MVGFEAFNRYKKKNVFKYLTNVLPYQKCAASLHCHLKEWLSNQKQIR